jgi:SAM-dependent methyltransferase
MLTPQKALKELDVFPISNKFGMERGTPIDRFYIEQYLSTQSHLITGVVVEIAENTYTLKFGQAVQKSEILHVDTNYKQATIIADLSIPETVPENIADFFICTQTLHLIYDIKKAVESIHKILKVNGQAIITAPGISQISRFDMDRWGDYWRFTDKSLRNILTEVFGEDNVEVTVFGNVFSATMLLQGLAVEEIDANKLAVKDANYQVILGAIVTKK